MNFHGHDINLESVSHSIALEYAKSELRNSEKEAVDSGKTLAPQDKIETLYSEYFMAYGYLCNNSEESARALLEHNYIDD